MYYSVDTKIFLRSCKRNCRYLCFPGNGHHGLTSSNTFSLIKDLGLVDEHNTSIFLCLYRFILLNNEKQFKMFEKVSVIFMSMYQNYNIFINYISQALFQGMGRRKGFIWNKNRIIEGNGRCKLIKMIKYGISKENEKNHAKIPNILFN